jgi:hypothetical protein
LSILAQPVASASTNASPKFIRNRRADIRFSP